MTSIEMKGAAMIKFKEFNVGDADYKEQMEQFQTEHQNAEFVQITGGHMDYEKIWFKYDDNINQPQLTIPKSIADELDRVEMNWNTLKDEAQGWPTDDLIMWLDAGNNPLMFAYLAGKALGVDLVKVVEG